VIFLGVLFAYLLVALILAFFIGAAFRLGGWSEDLLLLDDEDSDVA
jgi:hypothetical protein